MKAHCPDCGAPLGGRDGCDAAFHELGARAYADVGFAYRRRSVVDAYALQHPAYILSLKSFSAHLCGLCAAVERSGDPRAHKATLSHLRIPPDAVKPLLPVGRAALTIAEVLRATSHETFRPAVDIWIAEVWKAWSEHHGLARAWLDYSVESMARGGHRRQ